MQRVQLELADQLYDEAKRRALDSGFNSVDAYVVEVLSVELGSDTEDFDHLFTPERIAHLEKVDASVTAGGSTYTIEEVKAYLAAKRSAWICQDGK